MTELNDDGTPKYQNNTRYENQKYQYYYDLRSKNQEIRNRPAKKPLKQEKADIPRKPVSQERIFKSQIIDAYANKKKPNITFSFDQSKTRTTSRILQHMFADLSEQKTSGDFLQRRKELKYQYYDKYDDFIYKAAIVNDNDLHISIKPLDSYPFGLNFFERAGHEHRQRVSPKLYLNNLFGNHEKIGLSSRREVYDRYIKQYDQMGFIDLPIYSQGLIKGLHFQRIRNGKCKYPGYQENQIQSYKSSLKFEIKQDKNDDFKNSIGILNNQYELAYKLRHMGKFNFDSGILDDSSQVFYQQFEKTEMHQIKLGSRPQESRYIRNENILNYFQPMKQSWEAAINYNPKVQYQYFKFKYSNTYRYKNRLYLDNDQQLKTTLEEAGIDRNSIDQKQYFHFPLSFQNNFMMRFAYTGNQHQGLHFNDRSTIKDAQHFNYISNDLNNDQSSPYSLAISNQLKLYFMEDTFLGLVKPYASFGSYFIPTSQNLQNYKEGLRLGAGGGVEFKLFGLKLDLQFNLYRNKLDDINQVKDYPTNFKIALLQE